MINQTDPNTESVDEMFNKVTKGIKNTPWSKFLKNLNKQIKNWHKSKHVSKFLKQLAKYSKGFDNYDKESKRKMIGGILLWASRYISQSQNNYTFQEPKAKESPSFLPGELCAECDEEIDNDYFLWHECEYFVCQDCEEDTEHEHALLKIKSNKQYKANKKEQNKKPVITNFPVPKEIGIDWSMAKNIEESKSCISNSDLIQWNSEGKWDPNDWIKKQQKQANRPAIIQAPEENIVGKPGTYVIANFVIQNLSKYKLPKELYLKQITNFDLNFKPIWDKDALESMKTKNICIPIQLPIQEGEYRCIFAYFNVNGKKMGGDLIVTIISNSNI